MGAHFDVSGALRASKALAAVPKKMETARVRAVSNLTRALPPEASRDIRGEFNLTAARVGKGLSVVRTDSYVELVGSGAGIGIGQGYRGRQTKTGVVATLRKDSGPTRFKHAFLAIPGGKAEKTGVQAFQRAGKGAPRYPLQRLFSQTIAGMLRDKDRAQRLGDFGMRILSKEISRQLGVLSG